MGIKLINGSEAAPKKCSRKFQKFLQRNTRNRFFFQWDCRFTVCNGTLLRICQMLFRMSFTEQLFPK